MNFSPHLLAFAAVLLSPAVSAGAAEFDSDGVPIQYSVRGEGSAVILIHGLYSSARLNWDLPGITSALAREHMVVTLDNRGHGQSGKPQAEGEYGEKMVGDVIRLMDHLKIRKADIVGYSLGGMIALKLVAEHPQRVDSAILGGMGWLRTGTPLQRIWQVAENRNRVNVPAACVHGIADLALTEDEVRSIQTPLTMIVGDLDPCRRMYVDPLRRVRPDWPIHIVENAGHLNCIGTPEFTAELRRALDRAK
jgi:pimeloyl-ACP methyl ester carboxylesterase